MEYFQRTIFVFLKQSSNKWFKEGFPIAENSCVYDFMILKICERQYGQSGKPLELGTGRWL